MSEIRGYKEPLTPREALEHAKREQEAYTFKAQDRLFYKDFADFWNIVVDALEKQMPKKSTQDLRKGIECYCPICGAYVGWRGATASDLANFCSDCGQAIMPWEVDK